MTQEIRPEDLIVTEQDGTRRINHDVIESYGLFNLATGFRIPYGDGRWDVSLWAKNVFDKHYASAAALAENPFAGGSFQVDSASWKHETFVAPGAPRAAWLGLRYVFGG